MRILVTGGKGVIGQELLPMLKCHDVLIIDKKDGPDYTLGSSHRVIETVRAFRPEVVFHLAASFERTEESPDFFQTNWADNVKASHDLIEGLAGLDVRAFIFASSYLVYDEAQYLGKPYFHYPLYETSVVSPRNLCGMAKLYTEKELEFFKSRMNPAMQLVHARIFRGYGKDSRDLISRCIKTGKLPMWNAESSFDYIHARDSANGMLKLWESHKSGVFNLGTGVSTKIGKVFELTGCEFNSVVSDSVVETSVASIARLEEATGWRPEITIEKGIAELKEYYG